MSNINDNNPNPTGDKRTLIAVILSVVVITAGFMIQGVLFPPAKPAPQATSSVAAPAAQAAAVPGSPGAAPAATGFVAAPATQGHAERE